MILRMSMLLGLVVPTISLAVALLCPVYLQGEDNDHGLAKLSDGKLRQLVDVGNEQARHLLLARRGITYRRQGVGGGWIEETMVKNGVPTEFISFVAPAPVISSANYSLTIACAGSGGLMLMIGTKYPKSSPWKPNSEVRISLSFISSGQSEQSDKLFIAFPDLLRDSAGLLPIGLIDNSSPSKDASKIAHSDVFSFSAGDQHAVFNTKGLHLAEFERACVLKPQAALASGSTGTTRQSQSSPQASKSAQSAQGADRPSRPLAGGVTVHGKANLMHLAHDTPVLLTFPCTFELPQRIAIKGTGIGTVFRNLAPQPVSSRLAYIDKGTTFVFLGPDALWKAVDDNSIVEVGNQKQSLIDFIFQSSSSGLNIGGSGVVLNPNFEFDSTSLNEAVAVCKNRVH